MSQGLVIGIAGGVLGLGIIVLLVVLLRSPGNAKPTCMNCSRVMASNWPKCMFCGAPAPVAGQKAGAGQNPKLEFLCGPLAGQVIDLSEEITTIGSVAGNTIVLSDPAVSRKHVGIRKSGRHFEFADLGSTNGVYLNGHRIPKKNLAAGDVLRVGNTEMVFRTD